MYRVLSIFLFATVFLSGCTPPLEKWVKDRGYNFDKNYTNRQLLGATIKKDKNGDLYIDATKKDITVTGDEAKATDIFIEKDRNFKISATADIKKAFAYLADANASIESSKIDHAEFSVSNPYASVVRLVSPINPCPKGKSTRLMAWEVLNTGKLRMSFKDELNNTVDIKAVIPNIADPKFNIKYDENSQTIETGDDMFVGFKPYAVTCSVARDFDYPISKGKYDNHIYKDRGLYLAFARFKYDDNGTGYAYVTVQRTPLMSVSEVDEIQKQVPDKPVSSAVTATEASRQTIVVQEVKEQVDLMLGSNAKKTRIASELKILQGKLQEAQTSTVKIDDAIQFASKEGTKVDGEVATNYKVKNGDKLIIPAPDGHPCYILMIKDVNQDQLTVDLWTIVYAPEEQVTL